MSSIIQIKSAVTIKNILKRYNHRLNFLMEEETEDVTIEDTDGYAKDRS